MARSLTMLNESGDTTISWTEDLDDQVWKDLVHSEHSTCPGHSARIIDRGPQRVEQLAEKLLKSIIARSRALLLLYWFP